MKIQLIDNWFKSMFTLASTRVAWVAGIMLAYFSANPDQWVELNQHLPWWGHVLVGLGITLIAGGSRVITFRKD
jgi:hypothetical protein